MQSYTITQYQTFGPGLDNLARDIESILQVYTGFAAVFAALILIVVACLLVCEVRQSKENKPASRRAVSRRPALAARELSDTGF